MFRKIKRIFLKSVFVLFLSLLLLLGTLLIGIQTFGFQTWLAGRAASWLSSELHTTVHISRVELEFFRSANLRNILVLDKKKDTLLAGDLLLNVSGFNFTQQRLTFDRIILQNVTAKVVEYQGDSSFNYQFIADYFGGNDKKDTSANSWDLKFGDLKLQNVHLVYRRENAAAVETGLVNFDNADVRELYGLIRKFEFKGDTVAATLHQLRFKDHSGFAVNSLSTNFEISSRHLRCGRLHLATPGTQLQADVLFTYRNWEAYEDFLTKVTMSIRFKEQSYISMKDVSAFSSDLLGLKEKVYLKGTVKGTVADLRLRNFDLKFGEYSRFRGDLQITGLPDIKSTFLHFDAKELAVQYDDLVSLPQYPFKSGIKLDLPAELRSLGKVTYRGKFDGFLSDFSTYGTFETGIGSITADLRITLPDSSGPPTYRGRITTDQFGLGTLLGQKDFNKLSVAIEVDGKGSTLKELDAVFKGEVTSLEYNNYTYSQLTVNGYVADKLFNGVLTAKDPNADFDFNGTIDFTEKVPQMDFISTLNKLNLHALNFTSKQDSGVLSSQILIKINGSNADNLSGLINFDNTIYKTRTRSFKLSTFAIQAEQTTADKKIKISSEYLNASVFGRFKVANLQPAIENLLNYYYPTYFPKPKKIKSYDDALGIFLRVKKFKTINELFIPELMLSPNTLLEGSLDARENTFNLQLNSPLASYNSFAAKDLVFILNQNGKQVLAEASVRNFLPSDSLSLDNFKIAVNSADTLSRYSVAWDNQRKPASKGDIEGQINLGRDGITVANKKLTVTIQDSTWTQQKAAELFFAKNGDLSIQPFSITNALQRIELGGALSSRAADSLIIGVNNLGLQQFNGILKPFSLKLEGVADGRVSINNSDAVKAYNGFLKLRELKLNDNLIGELVTHTEYHSQEKFVSLDGYTSLGLSDELGRPVKNISFAGRYDLDNKDESINIDFDAQPANLSLMNPFLTDIITIKKGFVKGAGKIHGNSKDIRIDGKFRLFNSEIKVDYTNVTYLITGDIEVMPDQIRFSDLLMREKDTKSAPQGTINGNVFHRQFSNWQIDYDITYQNMMVLNTTEKENKYFYGKLYGTGNIGIYGYLNKLHMQIDNTTNKNSRFILPLDGPAEIEENDFIHFVKKDTTHQVAEKHISGFDLDMVVHATNDAQAQIIIDKKSGDMLNVYGSGDLSLRLNTLGKFEMIGDYSINSGDYLFTLENVINKKFDIESGSSISWSGDPMNADINIVTAYRQRASVAPLLNDTTGAFKGRTPVECKLIITNKLFSPSINFAIDFPNLDGTSKSRISSVLSDETELNRQVFSFLLFRTFATPLIYNSNVGGVTAGGAAASTGSELLSNRVSEFLNTYFGSLSGIKDLELGLNYRPGTQTSNETVDLALSKQFLDNKISVDGNFGVNQNARNSNALIGDVNVDYKLTSDGRLRLKGFNRSNDNTQITTAGGPYTQGVGFFYRVEFDSLNELWRLFNAKTKKKEVAAAK